jgi:hypothetical protein
MDCSITRKAVENISELSLCSDSTSWYLLLSRGRVLKQLSSVTWRRVGWSTGGASISEECAASVFRAEPLAEEGGSRLAKVHGVTLQGVISMVPLSGLWSLIFTTASCSTHLYPIYPFIQHVVCCYFIRKSSVYWLVNSCVRLSMLQIKH